MILSNTTRIVQHWRYTCSNAEKEISNEDTLSELFNVGMKLASEELDRGETTGILSYGKFSGFWEIHSELEKKEGFGEPMFEDKQEKKEPILQRIKKWFR